jgi:hypothetical protein
MMLSHRLAVPAAPRGERRRRVPASSKFSTVASTSGPWWPPESASCQWDQSGAGIMLGHSASSSLLLPPAATAAQTLTRHKATGHYPVTQSTGRLGDATVGDAHRHWQPAPPGPASANAPNLKLPELPRASSTGSLRLPAGGARVVVTVTGTPGAPGRRGSTKLRHGDHFGKHNLSIKKHP